MPEEKKRSHHFSIYCIIIHFSVVVVIGFVQRKENQTEIHYFRFCFSCHSSHSHPITSFHSDYLFSLTRQGHFKIVNRG